MNWNEYYQLNILVKAKGVVVYHQNESTFMAYVCEIIKKRN